MNKRVGLGCAIAAILWLGASVAEARGRGGSGGHRGHAGGHAATSHPPRMPRASSPARVNKPRSSANHANSTQAHAGKKNSGARSANTSANVAANHNKSSKTNAATPTIGARSLTGGVPSGNGNTSSTHALTARSLTGGARTSAAAATTTTNRAANATTATGATTTAGTVGTVGTTTGSASPMLTYGTGSGARRYRSYGYGSGYRNRSYGGRYGYGRSQGNNRAVVARLRSVHSSLAQLDHDYQGHRVRAMHSISMAIRQLSHRSMVYSNVGFNSALNNNALGMRRNGNGNGNRNGNGVNGRNGGMRMTQAQSDARMSQALRTLQGIQMQLSSQGSTTGHARARGHVQRATQELNTALMVR